jgi:hypothetical protein
VLLALHHMSSVQRCHLVAIGQTRYEPAANRVE